MRQAIFVFVVLLNINKLHFTSKHTYPIGFENTPVIIPITGGIFFANTALGSVVAPGLSTWMEQP